MKRTSLTLSILLILFAGGCSTFDYTNPFFNVTEKLGYAANINDTTGVKKFLSKGADPNSDDRWCRIITLDAKRELCDLPLFAAIYYNNYEMTEDLIKAGVDVRRRNQNGVSPLTASIKNHHLSLTLLLIRNGANDSQDNYFWGEVINTLPPREYIESVYEEFFLLKYYGGWSFIEAYNLPIKVRRWFLDKLVRQMEKEKEPLKILAILKREIPARLLGVRQIWQIEFVSKREVILSEWLEGNSG